MFEQILTSEKLKEIFPRQRTNEFFEALFGDASEGAYDIELVYRSDDHSSLTLELLLHQRPENCLACNLTQGLPQVFSRHPVIDIAGVVRAVDNLLGDDISCEGWELGYTRQHSGELHGIPLVIQLKRAG